jgi:hypothetical protein
VAKYLDIDTIITVTSETLRAGTIIERKAELQSSNGIISVSIHERLPKDSVVRVSKTEYRKTVRTHPDVFYSGIKQVKDTVFFNPWIGNSTNRSRTYFYKLINRGRPITFKFSTFEVGAMTIPFKYRFSYKKGGRTVPDEFVPNFNAGVLLSQTWGEQTFFYWKNQEDRSPKTRKVKSIGLFLGISTTKLDSANTSLATEYLKYEKTVAMFSTGLGYMKKRAGVSAGLFFGLDFPVGDAGRKWNYRDRPWFGFGFGYDIPMLAAFKQ